MSVEDCGAGACLDMDNICNINNGGAEYYEGSKMSDTIETEYMVKPADVKRTASAVSKVSLSPRVRSLAVAWLLMPD